MDHVVDYEAVVSCWPYADYTGGRGGPPRWTYRIAMQDGVGKSYFYGGRYQEIREPRSLAFTWAPYGDSAIETLVLHFRQGIAGANTKLELSHLGLLHEQMRDDHEAVWNICLDRLEETR